MKKISEFGNKPVLVDFWLPSCGPCLLIGKELDILQQKGEIPIIKIDLSQKPDLAISQKVMGLPTVRIYGEQGILAEKLEYQSAEQLEQWYFSTID